MAGCQEGSPLVDDEFMVRLSSLIGVKWMTLGRLLKIDNVRLEVMKANNPGNMEEAVFQMLSCWKLEAGLDATYRVLGRALEDAKRPDLATYVCKGQLPNDHPPSGVPLFDIRKQLRKDLEWFYIHKLCKIPVSPWEGQKIPIREIYTNVQLLMNTPNPQEGQLQVPLQDHHQLFCPEARQLHGTRSILRGKAGSGKSTTVARLAYDWAEMDESSHLTNYDLLFVLRMRNMNPGQSFGEAIISQLLPTDGHYTRENLENFIKGNEEKIAIIFDGYDEYSLHPPNAASPHHLMDILQGDRLRHCCILVTMRPWKALESKELSDYTVYEVKGFSPKNVDNYIMEKSFNRHPEKGRQLVDYLEVNNLKESIACIPLLTSLLCHLWRSDPTVLDKPPTSLGQLFSCLCSCFRSSHRQEDDSSSSEEDPLDDDSGEDEVEDLLEAMGPTALNGLFEDRQELTFPYPSLRETLGKEVLKKGKFTGLLTYEEKLSFKSSPNNKSARARKRKEKHVSFYHKVVQEYCAGIHLARLKEVDEKKFQEYVQSITTVIRAIDLSYVLLFASWSSQEAARGILDLLVNIFHRELESKADGFFDGTLGLRECYQMQKFFELCLHINYESQSEGSLNEQLQFIHSRGSVRLVGISTYTADALAYYLKYVSDEAAVGRSNQMLNSLELMQLSMQSTTSIRELGRHFPSAENLHTQYMQLYTRKRPEELDHLRSSCEPKVTKSVLGMDHWNNYEFVSKFHLVQILEDWQSSQTNLSPIIGMLGKLRLTKLTLTGHNLGKIVDLLKNALESENLFGLRYLNLSHCKMTEAETEILAGTLHNLDKLEELNMANNELGADFGEQLAKLENIKVLVLESTSHRAEVTEKFLKAFQSLVHLSYLEFRHNTIDDSGGKTLTRSLQQLKDLQALRFSSSNMSFKVLAKLINAIGKLGKLKNLQVLHIRWPNQVFCLLAGIISNLKEIEDVRISGFSEETTDFVEVEESEVINLVQKLCELEQLRMFSLLLVKISLPLLTHMVTSFSECRSSNFEILRITQRLVVTSQDIGDLFGDVKFLRLW